MPVMILSICIVFGEWLVTSGFPNFLGWNECIGSMFDFFAFCFFSFLLWVLVLFGFLFCVFLGVVLHSYFCYWLGLDLSFPMLFVLCCCYHPQWPSSSASEGFSSLWSTPRVWGDCCLFVLGGTLGHLFILLQSIPTSYCISHRYLFSFFWC